MTRMEMRQTSLNRFFLSFFFVSTAENYGTPSEHIISKLPLIRIYIYSYLKPSLHFFYPHIHTSLQPLIAVSTFFYFCSVMSQSWQKNKKKNLDVASVKMYVNNLKCLTFYSKWIDLTR